MTTRRYGNGGQPRPPYTKSRKIIAVGCTATIACVAAGATPALPRATEASFERLSGRLVFAAGDGASDRFEIASVDPDGRRFRRLTHLPVSGRDPRWTSDGRRILFVSDDLASENSANWEMRSDGRRLRRIVGDEYDPPSPSGRLVARLGAGIRVVTAGGRTVRSLPWRLRRGDSYLAAFWSPDARYLAIAIATETETAEYSWVAVIAIDGHTRAHAVTRRRSGSDAALTASSWSPDSRRLLLKTTSQGRRSWLAVTPDGQDRRRMPALGSASAIAWAPDSRAVAFVSRDGAIFRINRAGGAPSLVVRPTSAKGAGRSVRLDWSRRNEIAFSDKRGTYVIAATGGAQRRLTALAGDPRWSPDGTRIVFEAGNEIFVVQSLTGAVKRLTRWVWDAMPEWSPDRSLITYVHGRREAISLPDLASSAGPPRSGQVYVMRADGSHRHLLGHGDRPHWAPDNRRLVAVDYAPATTPLELNAGRLRPGRVTVIDTGNRRRHTVGRGTAAVWSPAREQIAFMRYTLEAGEHGEANVARSTLLTVRPDGSQLRALAVSGTDEGGSPVDVLYDPSWSPDGATLAARSEDASGSRIALIDANAGTMTTVGAEVACGFAWSPDGTTIAYVTHDGAAIALAPATPSATRLLLRKRSASFCSPTWSPDGTRVAFIGCAANFNPPCDLYSVRTSGHGLRRLTRRAGIEAGVNWR